MITRRDLALGLAGVAFGTAAPAARRTAGLGLDDRSDFLQAVVKMRGSTDTRLCIGWVTGTRYAVIDHRAVPMMGLLAATFTQYRRRDPGAYDVRSLEVAFFTDLRTGKLIRTWRNPVTDRVVDVPMTRMGPSRFTITADGLQVEGLSGEAAGLDVQHTFQPAVVRGDDVWITEVIGIGGQVKAAAENPFVYNEMSTYHAKLSELADPARATVPTQVAFHGLVTYRPWMGFGDTPGHTTAHGAGTRAPTVADLPKYYADLARAFHPDVIADPLAVLNGADD